MEELQGIFEEVDKLCQVSESPDNPFASKYQAREILEQTRADLEKNGASLDDIDSPAIIKLGLIDYRLGCIAHETEENHVAEIKLNQCLEAFCPGFVKVAIEIAGLQADESQNKAESSPELALPDDSELASIECTPSSVCREAGCIGDLVGALNQIGILWSSRDQPRRAMVFLSAAKNLCEKEEAAASQVLPPPPDGEVPPDLPPQPAPASPGVQPAEDPAPSKLQQAYTLTLFYLAQAWGHLGHPAKSASYCQETLGRQLLPGEALDKSEWVKNCMGLGDYYLGINRLQAVDACLTACLPLLKELKQENPDASEDTQERLTSLQADLDRRQGHLWLAVLQIRHEQQVLIDSGAPEMVSDLAPDDGEADSVRTSFSLVLQRASGENISGLTPLPAPSSITNFDQARDVFKNANRHFEAAKNHYVLDGYVTDHVNLLRDQSQLYRFLALFEQDDKRKQAMHTRRIAMLEPLLQVLNKNVYDNFHKQLSYEVAETYSAIVDLKISRIEAKENPKKVEVNKCNEFCQKAIDNFQYFADIYMKGPEDSGEPKEIPKEQLGPYLRSHFHIARLLGKKLYKEDKDIVDTLSKSYAKYEWLIPHAKKELDRVDDWTIFEQEYQICQQMVELLPEKINRMHHKGTALS